MAVKTLKTLPAKLVSILDLMQARVDTLSKGKYADKPTAAKFRAAIAAIQSGDWSDHSSFLADWISKMEFGAKGTGGGEKEAMKRYAGYRKVLGLPPAKSRP